MLTDQAVKDLLGLTDPEHEGTIYQATCRNIPKRLESSILNTSSFLRYKCTSTDACTFSFNLENVKKETKAFQ